MTELDLILIRQREHEIARLELLLKKQEEDGGCVYPVSIIERDIFELEQAKILTIRTLEQQGTDYFTITAEIERIRAEVRGEK